MKYGLLDFNAQNIPYYNPKFSEIICYYEPMKYVGSFEDIIFKNGELNVDALEYLIKSELLYFCGLNSIELATKIFLKKKNTIEEKLFLLN